jgi:hypothetical protein
MGNGFIFWVCIPKHDVSGRYHRGPDIVEPCLVQTGQVGPILFLSAVISVGVLRILVTSKPPCMPDCRRSSSFSAHCTAGRHGSGLKTGLNSIAAHTRQEWHAVIVLLCAGNAIRYARQTPDAVPKVKCFYVRAQTSDRTSQNLMHAGYPHRCQTSWND